MEDFYIFFCFTKHFDMSATAHFGGWSPKLGVNCQPTWGMLAGLEREMKRRVERGIVGERETREHRKVRQKHTESRWRGAEGRRASRRGSQRPGDSR